MRAQAVLEKYREHLDRGCLNEDWSALPYRLARGFEIEMDEYQVLLVRRAGGCS